MIVKLDQYVTAKEAASMAGMNVEAFIYHMRKGHTPTIYKIGSSTVLLRADMQSWQKPKNAARGRHVKSSKCP